LKCSTWSDGQGWFLSFHCYTKYVKVGFFEAVGDSFVWIGLVFGAVASLFNPGTFQQTVQDTYGVVGISVEVARAARAGALDYAWLVAFLSLSLGVLNIFPIPPLDGGKIVLELVERASGRPMRREWSLGLSAAGALIIFSLIGYLMYLDVVRYVING
jgi:regulator of sigma E protease